MPIHEVSLVSVAVCDLCGASQTHASTPASPLALEYFLALGWAVIAGTTRDPNAFTSTPAKSTVCPRCAPVVLESFAAVFVPRTPS